MNVDGATAVWYVKVCLLRLQTQSMWWLQLNDYVKSLALFADACIVCHGSSCSPTYSDVTFHNCTLVVLSGAHVTLVCPQFTASHSPSSSVTIFAHGTGSKVVVEGGTVTEGKQAATVQAGARLEASDLAITHMELAGVEVKDEGSSVHLSGCTLSNFLNVLCGNCSSVDDVRGIHCAL